MGNYTEKFERCQLIVKGKEAGYANHPSADSGGETIFGVARNPNPNWEGWSRVDELAALYGRGTPSFIEAVNNDQVLYEMALEFFYEVFWSRIRGDELPPDGNLGVDLVIYDMAINSGPSRAIKTLQKAVGSPVNGKISDTDVEAVNNFYGQDPQGFLEKLIKKRLEFYQWLRDTDPRHGAPNYRGWLNRLKSIADCVLGYIPDFMV